MYHTARTMYNNLNISIKKNTKNIGIASCNWIVSVQEILQYITDQIVTKLILFLQWVLPKFNILIREKEFQPLSHFTLDALCLPHFNVDCELVFTQ